MKLDDPYFLTLQKIHQLALLIESEIQSFQPKLLVVLARGGFAPLWALQALWEVKNKACHLPFVITNLGREKLRRYEFHREAIGVNFMPLIEPFDFFGPGERGYFLAWLTKQTDWRCELRQQVEKVLGSGCRPARILVIDDTVDKRYTTLIALGLLAAEFPDAETRMLAGELPHWRLDLSIPWLKEHSVDSHLSEKEFINCVYNLAHGASDIDPGSLQWEKLTASSLAMKEYGKYLPVETWLELNGWLQEQIKTYICQTINLLDGPQAELETVNDRKNDYRAALEPEEIFFLQRWLSADLTPDEAANELDMSVDDASGLLKNLRAG